MWKFSSIFAKLSIFIRNNDHFCVSQKSYKSYYKRGNPRPQEKNPIEAGDMKKLKSYFSIDDPRNFVVEPLLLIGPEKRQRGRVGLAIKQWLDLFHGSPVFRSSATLVNCQ